MELIEIIKAVADVADTVSTLLILLAWISIERKRADELTREILSDWKRQNDREADKTRES